MESIAKISNKIREITEIHLKEKGIKCDNLVINKAHAFSSKEDFHIPHGCHFQMELNVLRSLRDELTQRLQSEGCAIAKIEGDKWNSFCIYLDRTRIFKEVVTDVLERKNSCFYTLTNCEKKTPVILNIVGPDQGKLGDILDNLSLEWVRFHVLHQHIQLLLQAHGYQVQTVSCNGHFTDQQQALLNEILVDLSCISSVESEKCGWTGSLEHLLQHPHVTKIEWESRDSINIGTASVKSGAQPVPQGQDETKQKYLLSVFDLKKFIADKKLPMGKKGFDQNLTICNVAKADKPSDICREVCALGSVLQTTQPICCVHIVSQSRSIRQQKVHLMLQAVIEEGSSKYLIQKHFIHGSVVPRKDCSEGDVVCAKQYINLRYKQMREAAVMKYGDAVKGEGWENTLRSLTAACIKFELLSTVARNTVKLSLSELETDSGGELTSGGAFVMYNCARLATLFSHYDEAVVKGIYPPLPSVKDIDWSNLKEEQEWVLLFDYVCMFPEVVKHSVHDLTPDDSIHTELATHKVCQFLSSLSRCLSSYYSRYHVLGEAREHLLPTMFARLYLLKALHQILVNGLALLGISPISQL